ASPGAVSPCPAILVVFALAVADAKLRQERWARRVELGVRVERRLIDPTLEQGQAVGIHRALEDLELLAARLLHHLSAPALLPLRELRALARYGGGRHHESGRHRSISLVSPAFPLPPPPCSAS